MNDDNDYVLENGNKIWMKNGQYHRNDDKPALICDSGSKYWY